MNNDFTMKQQISPTAIADILQKKFQVENQQQQDATQRSQAAFQQTAQSVSNMVSNAVAASQARQKKALVNSLADAMASKVTPNLAPQSVHASGFTGMPVPGGTGPSTGPMAQPITSTANFNPDATNASQDAMRAAVKLDPASFAEQQAKSAFVDPNKQLLEQQLKNETLKGKMLSNQAKSALGAPVPETVKSMLRAQGIDVPDEMTTGDLKTVLPGLGAASRSEALKEMAKARNDSVSATLAERMGKDLDPAQWTSGPGKTAADKVLYAQNAKRLFDQVRAQPEGANARQVTESAIEQVRALIGSGALSEKLVHDMVPQTAMKKYKTWEEFFRNEPTGVDAKAFMDQAEDTIRRVEEGNQKYVNDTIKQRISKHGVLKKRDPDLYNAQLEAAGIDPADVENGRYTPTTPKPFDNKPPKAAGTKKMSPQEEADAFLKGF